MLLVALLLPFFGSIAAAFLPVNARNTAAGLSGLISATSAIILCFLYPLLAGGASIRLEIPWVPLLGLHMILRLDGLSFIFAFMVTGIGSLMVLYARYYMSAEDPVPRFFSFLMAFMGSMLGLVLSGNLIQLAFFWEMTSLFSFLLIGYWHHNQSARDGARMSLIVTGAGGMCLLLGVLLIGQMVGSYDIDIIRQNGDLVRASSLYTPAVILILVGAFSKSAQFPFHFWLPQAMAAPTPVSAYLHSATMVKAGIFVMMLLWPVLAGTKLWFFIVVSAGLTTMLIGAWNAIFQQDLKGLLAYSTISHLGIITLLLGLGSPLAAVAAVFHTVNHATFKASLFMAAGIIDHETGTRDLRRLSGLYRYMPITATLAMVAAAAMAGVPLLNGFISKEMFLAEALAGHQDNALDQALPYLATLASTFSVLYSIRFIHQTFFGPPPVDLPHQPSEAPPWMRLPIEILVLACLLVGILPAITIGPFLNTAILSMMGDNAPSYSLAIWHGFSVPLMMSFTALISGTVLYIIYGDRLNTVKSPPIISIIEGRRAFEKVLAVLMGTAERLKVLLGTRRLQSQLRLLVYMAILLGGLPFVFSHYVLGSHRLTPVDPVFAFIWLLGGSCAVGAAIQAKYHRLAALILMGGAGLATCASFLWLSAPDLAVTQLLVEIVTTVLLLLGLRWLPKRLPELWEDGRPVRVTVRRSADIIIALVAGAGMSALAYAVMTRPMPESISRYFLEHAYTLGGGTNVVNVLLVDFRGFDTLGEITVLAIVGLTIFSVLRRFRPARETVGITEQQRVQNAYDEARPDRSPGDTLTDYLAVPQLIMQWLFPVIVVFAIFLLMRGHDLPGGGFAAGITISIGLIVQYMASGTRKFETQLTVRPLRWIGFGLLTAIGTGVGAWFFGRPFLTSHFQYVELPLIGKMPAASAFLFDIGVCAVVVGSTVLVLIALAHQSIRTPRVIEPEATGDI